jgi:hypothetical protein
MANLSQVIGLINGETYKITFDADITSGVLQVYQGTQEIFSTEVVSIKSVKDVIHISEDVIITRVGPTVRLISSIDSATCTEDVTLTIT